MANFNAIRYNVPYSSAGNLKLITTSTASSSATISFTSGIDSTYKEYLFIFNSIHAQTDGAKFQFQGDTGTNTSYNQQITSTNFRSYHNEADGQTGLSYITGGDQANGTAFQNLSEDSQGADADQCLSGTLRLFDPSNTTFVKNFMAEVSNLENAYEGHTFTAGYGNTTSAVDAIQFKMSSGNIDAGTIQMFGVL